MLHLQGRWLWRLAWTCTAVRDSPLGFSCWGKLCSIQRPCAGSALQPAMAHAAQFFPRGCEGPAASPQPPRAPRLGLCHLTSVGTLLPGGQFLLLLPCSFPASCPEPLLRSVEALSASPCPSSISASGWGWGLSKETELNPKQLPWAWGKAHPAPASSHQSGTAQETWPRDCPFQGLVVEAMKSLLAGSQMGVGLTGGGLGCHFALLCLKAKCSHSGQDPSNAVTLAWKFPQCLVRKPALSHWEGWLLCCSSAMLSF